jgi:hypothetical protein
LKLNPILPLFFIATFLVFHNLTLQVANARNESQPYELLLWVKLSGTLLVGSTLVYFDGTAQAALIGAIFGIFFFIQCL